MSKNTASKNRQEFNGKNCHTPAESDCGKSKNKASHSAYDSYESNSSAYEKSCGKEEYGKNR